ncbi:MAG: DNA polymerase III subunit alpha [Spirochaetaceae bacterium]|jgi:DNA polymerase-3 subunit alpha|nr:DNA polymerase III subunit alpha [Spirochaetaceae bacterium]
MTDFVHLHVHTDYSLVDSAAKIKPLVARAKELGMKALAITDHGNMCGVINFVNACTRDKDGNKLPPDKAIKPIIGCEFYVAGGSRTNKTGTEEGNRYYHLILLAKNEQGYKNLVYLTSRSYTEGFYYKPRIDTELIELYHEGLVCLTACVAGELPQLLMNGKQDMAIQLIAYYKNLFGAENYFIELQDHGLEAQKNINKLLIEIAKKTNTPMVVTNDSHFILREDWQAHEILTCIGHKITLKDPKHIKFYQSYTKEHYLKSGDEMAELFPDYPEMVRNSVRIAEMCNCTIPQYKTEQLKECLPVYAIPDAFKSEDEYIRHLVFSGLKKRYGDVNQAIEERTELELSTIIRMGFIGYFLIVWDFINWAKEHDIPIGPGRGSGAGSIVAYAMGITDIDPLKYKLLFERFLNPERISMPDFDIDISDDGRQAVIEYTRQKYGEAQVGHIVTFGTLAPKAVIKDIGRALDIPLAEVVALTDRVPDSPKTHLIDAFTVNKDIPGSGRLSDMRHDPAYEHLFDICFKLEGVKRNTSLHASGIVIGKSPLPDWAPIMIVKDNKSEKKDEYVTATQYTMDIIEPCGLVKMDYLGLKTLSIIKNTVKLVVKKKGCENFSIDTIEEHDEGAFDLFCDGKTTGFFQFESPGMVKVLRQAKPRSIEELTALNALYRPGPMDYIPKFIEGKFNPGKITYPDPCLKDILEETYGVMVYQEQVMQVAQRIAGYSLGQADLLRRAMGKKKIEVMASEKEKFIVGALTNGFNAKHAGDIFDIMLPFAGYGFNKSHAAAYSVLAYQTAFLRTNFPIEFMAATLTNQIYGADNRLSDYIEEVRGSGIEITVPDINTSRAVFEVVADKKTGKNKIAFGLLGIKGLGEYAAEEIVTQRETNGQYKSFIDFITRVDLHSVNKRALEVLIKTGCFDSLGQTRPTLFANLEKAVEFVEKDKKDLRNGQTSLFGDASEENTAEMVFEQVPDWTLKEKLDAELELVGCYVSGHPLDPFREKIKNCCTITSANAAQKIIKVSPPASGDNKGWKTYREERDKRTKHTIIGIIKNIKEITTKKDGKKMAFATLEDLNGAIELVFFPKTWEEIGGSIQNETIAALRGVPELSKDGKPSLQVEEIADINTLSEKSWKEVHIRLCENSVQTEENLLPIRDYITEHSGSCSVYIHLPLEDGEMIIKPKASMRVRSEEEHINTLKDIVVVDDVWRE